jgi:hypothetical protein
MERMSKSGSTEKSIPEDLSVEVKLSALQSEVNYWKTRYELLKKYGQNKES